ncbi:MAG: hypothetical protein COA73_18925 [Candidatus Hydrogenedentota bacterium]|nr:MAG: hypothetical protein COA73_18925 [Candidatus Hydrogenedentota bacterium]
MHIRTHHWITIFTLTLTASVWAAETNAPKEVFTADSAYKAMLNLEGTWTGESNVVPVGKTKDEGTKSDAKVTYRTIANGSSIMATFLEGTPMEMVSMYHQDSPDALIHTHYCAVGNQPTMKFSPVTEKGVINFDFAYGTNMDVNEDGHVHSGWLKFIDENTMESETELWRDGKLNSIRYTRVTRQK